MTGQRLGMTTVAILAATTLVGCAATVSGSGRVTGASAPAGTSSPDFPSGSATTGSGASPSTAAPSTPPSRTTHPVPTAPLKTVTVHAAGGRTYVVKLWADVQDETCFDHAYGAALVTFLTQHPCVSLHRYLGTTAVSGRQVAFAQSSTAFRGPVSDPYKWASEFIKLENQDGTGSINDLLREGYRLPGGPSAIPASEVFNVVGQDQGVTVWDAWYLDGGTSDTDPKLTKMTEDLFLQF